MMMLEQAVARGADMAVLEKLMDLQERWEAHQAKKAYDAAIAAAKGQLPEIPKTKRVRYVSKTGVVVEYSHEELPVIAKLIDPVLSSHGLSYRFRTTSLVNEPVRVTCVVSHRDGYSEENTLEAGRDTSGSKNDIQAIGSTVTYLQRYTLKAALGLSAADDDDGRAAGKAAAITAEQLEELQKRIAHVGQDIPRFLKHYGVERIDDLPADKFDEAMAVLERKGAKP